MLIIKSIFFHSPSSYDDFYTEDDPVYGNLNQDILGELHCKNMCLFRGYVYIIHVWLKADQPTLPVSQIANLRIYPFLMGDTYFEHKCKPSYFTAICKNRTYTEFYFSQSRWSCSAK